MSTGSNSFYDDRRVHKRYRAESPVSVCYAGDFSIQKCVQISEGGMLLTAQDVAWSAGSHIEICLLIPGEKSVIINGEIVYDLKLEDHQNYAGVRFINTSDALQAVLRRYISTLNPL